MKRKLLFLGILLPLIFTTVFSQEPTFWDNTSGLRWRVVDEQDATAAIVKRKGNDSRNGYEKTVLIPEKVFHEGKEYTVITIDDDVFTLCERADKIKLSKTLVTIGANNFSWMGHFKNSIVIPDRVEKVGRDSFYRNAKLTSLSIGKGLKEWGQGSFTRNPKTCVITLSSENPYFKKVNDFILNTEGTTMYLYTGNTQTVEVPAGIKHIARRVFDGKYWLEEVTLHEGLESIGEHCFNGCEKLKEFTIPASVTEIGDSFLSSCDKLEKITVKAGNKHFIDQEGILYTIDKKILMKFPVNYHKPGETEPLKSFVVPETVTELAADAFECSKIESITLPAGLKTIGKGAFYAANLYTLKLPDGVEKIGSMAVCNLGQLAQVYLGPSLSFIGRNCFQFTKIKKLKINRDVPPYVEESFLGAFSLYTEEEGTLYVPIGKKEAYASTEAYENILHIEETTDFSLYANIVASSDDLLVGVKDNVLTIQVNGTNLVSIYDLEGRCLVSMRVEDFFSYELPQGVYIVKCANSVVKVVL